MFDGCFSRSSVVWFIANCKTPKGRSFSLEAVFSLSRSPVLTRLLDRRFVTPEDFSEKTNAFRVIIGFICHVSLPPSEYMASSSHHGMCSHRTCDARKSLLFHDTGLQFHKQADLCEAHFCHAERGRATLLRCFIVVGMYHASITAWCSCLSSPQRVQKVIQTSDPDVWPDLRQMP